MHDQFVYLTTHSYPEIAQCGQEISDLLTTEYQVFDNIYKYKNKANFLKLSYRCCCISWHRRCIPCSRHLGFLKPRSFLGDQTSPQRTKQNWREKLFPWFTLFAALFALVTTWVETTLYPQGYEFYIRLSQEKSHGTMGSLITAEGRSPWGPPHLKCQCQWNNSCSAPYLLIYFTLGSGTGHQTELSTKQIKLT